MVKTKDLRKSPSTGTGMLCFIALLWKILGIIYALNDFTMSNVGH